MDILWSASTTMRNPERTLSFLKTASEIEGDVWNEDTQCKYQTLLIKNRYYSPKAENLSEKQYALLMDYSHELSYAEADDIFRKKQYVDAPMRGRTSFDPLEKLGLVSLDENGAGNKIVRVTEFGRMFLDGDIDLGDVVFTNLLKTQFPNPLERNRQDYNIKPFIGTLHIIKRVNELCLCPIYGLKAVGISREEFGIFVLSMKSYMDIKDIAFRIVDFRQTKNSKSTNEEKIEFVYNYISKYLRNFQNPHKNVLEYTDNIIRYLRLTKYIYIRGGGYYIDLEPRRMVEIEHILKYDMGRAEPFTETKYKSYISDCHAYLNYDACILLFDDTESLTEIAKNIITENQSICANLGLKVLDVEIPVTTKALKRLISELRQKRTELQNLLIKHEYRKVSKIDEAITALLNILNHKTPSVSRPSIELEKWTNIALNILNDAILIKPNAPLGDDNEPTFTAAANVPDIECYYDGFGAICEVTMLSGRDQWFNEGQPVMRHLRSFEQANSEYENYCLFIAPRLHTDTINTFWTAVKYEYQGRRQKIVPITINGLVDILSAVRDIKAVQKSFHRYHIRRL